MHYLTLYTPTYSKRRWRVVETDLSDRELWGECDHEKKIIYLHKGMSPEMRRSVLWHETLHALRGYEEDLCESIELALPELDRIAPPPVPED